MYEFCDNTKRPRNFMAQGAEQAMNMPENLTGFSCSSYDLLSGLCKIHQLGGV